MAIGCWSNRTAGPPSECKGAFDSIDGNIQKLRAEMHLQLPKPGTEDWPELPPLSR